MNSVSQPRIFARSMTQRQTSACIGSCTREKSAALKKSAKPLNSSALSASATVSPPFTIPLSWISSPTSASLSKSAPAATFSPALFQISYPNKTHQSNLTRSLNCFATASPSPSPPTTPLCSTPTLPPNTAMPTAWASPNPNSVPSSKPASTTPLLSHLHKPSLSKKFCHPERIQEDARRTSTNSVTGLPASS